MDRKLTLDESKKMQIEMLSEFDRICRANNITYFLAYGTLLGAVRHKGYIPWDDDIDLMVPRPEMAKLDNAFKDCRYKYATVDNTKNYEYPFSRLLDTRTYHKYGKKKHYGLFIDIYPIDGIPSDGKGQEMYRKSILRYRNPRIFLIRLRNYIWRHIPMDIVPLIKFFTKKHREAISSFDYDSAKMVTVFDPHAIVIDKECFSQKSELEFEGQMYYVPKGWDNILTHWYGDYMQLPPEDKRHPYHGIDSIYIKED
jgi:licD1 protein